MTSLQKYHCRHHNLVDRYEISISQGPWILYVDVFFPLSPSLLLPDLTIYMSNTTGLIEAGTAYRSRPTEFAPGFLVVSVLLIFLPVSLDCPFLIAPLVFSNVYIDTMSVSLYIMFNQSLSTKTVPNGRKEAQISVIKKNNIYRLNASLTTTCAISAYHH